jgi:hypothetical protein
MRTTTGWLLFLFLALLPATSRARGPQSTHYEGTEEGTLLAVDAEGHFKQVPGASVQLRCIGPTEPGKHFNRSCKSSLTVTRGGKVIAKAERGLFGVDYDMVAGNDSNVSLALLPLSGGASLIILRSWECQGDEQMHEQATDQVFVLDGATLREVYQFESLSSFSPGPDEDVSQVPPSVRMTRVKLKADGGQTGQVQNLVRWRQTGEETSWEESSVLTWNGKQYVACPSCKPTRATSRTAPPPTAAVPLPALAAAASLLDQSTKVSIEPLLATVLRGERLTADGLQPLSAESLSRLRNAVYARHGRPFKSAALHSFFYGERSGAPTTKLLPRILNPAFVDTMLSDDDRANVAMVQAETRRRTTAGSARN